VDAIEISRSLRRKGKTKIKTRKRIGILNHVVLVREEEVVGEELEVVGEVTGEDLLSTSHRLTPRKPQRRELNVGIVIRRVIILLNVPKRTQRT
jgi:hypothetical protein